MYSFQKYDEQASAVANQAIIQELALLHASRLKAGEQRERIVGCITSGDFLSLCDLNPDYGELSVYEAANFRQVLAFFQKRADLGSASDRRRTAVVKFIEAEQLCSQTNDLFRMRALGKFSFLPSVEPALLRAQRKIARILGEVPSLESLKLKFGPGATTQVQKRNASAKRKLSSTFACSEDLLPDIQSVLGELPTWVNSNEDSNGLVAVEIHPGRLAFVPKNWKTDRSVVVEPSLNTMVQAGIGAYLVDRLLQFGVDLRDQSRNRDLARSGSLTGALATLDLSSASDTISTELIFDLLPVEWALFLSRYRTSRVVYDGITFTQEKFSSMGNGFTFPLESLIFYCLAVACSPEDSVVSVYGDDIIVPTEAVEYVMLVLNSVGFIVNKEKSFWHGPFRESCGGDYLKGIDIRPSYVKDRLCASDLMRLHNQYVRRGDQEAASLCLRYLGDPLRKWGPDGYGDGHLIGESRGLVPYGRQRGWGGYTFETYTYRPKRDFAILPGDRVYPFYASYVQGMTTIDALGRVTEVTSHEYKNGRLGVSIPGRGVYHLIKIYVLSDKA